MSSSNVVYQRCNESCIIPVGVEANELKFICYDYSRERGERKKKKRKDGYNFKVCGTIGYPFPLFPEDACGAVCHGAPQRATHQSRQQGVIIIFFLINDSTTKYDRIRW